MSTMASLRRRRSARIALVIVTSIATIAQGLSAQSTRSVVERFALGGRAAAVFELPDWLREASGLAVSADGRILTHGDERGMVAEIDLATRTAKARFSLGRPPIRGDFEGVATAGHRIFLATSDGVLYATDDTSRGRARFTRHVTGFGDRCELEGLAYEPDAQVLLFGCKVPREKTLEGFVTLFRWSVARAAPLAATRKRVHRSGRRGDPVRASDIVVLAGLERAPRGATKQGVLVDGVRLGDRHVSPKGCDLRRRLAPPHRRRGRKAPRDALHLPPWPLTRRHHAVPIIHCYRPRALAERPRPEPRSCHPVAVYSSPSSPSLRGGRFASCRRRRRRHQKEVVDHPRRCGWRPVPATRRGASEPWFLARTIARSGPRPSTSRCSTCDARGVDSRRPSAVEACRPIRFSPAPMGVSTSSVEGLHQGASPRRARDAHQRDCTGPGERLSPGVDVRRGRAPPLPTPPTAPSAPAIDGDAKRFTAGRVSRRVHRRGRDVRGTSDADFDAIDGAGGAVDVISSEKLFARLREPRPARVDADAYLLARLF